TTATFTDTFNKPVLVQRAPSVGITNFNLNAYDILENLVLSQDELGQTDRFSYDPLNRLQAHTNADGSVVSFRYDAAGNITNRVMPGGLVWQCSYDAAGREVSEQLQGAGSVNRQFTNVYYGQYDFAAGLLESKIDLGRNVTNTVTYDAYLRSAMNAVSGNLPDQNLSVTYQYDRRGLATNVTQTSSTINDAIQRAFDGYGQLSEEKVFINGVLQSDFTQNWNAAARRAQLAQTSAGSGGSITYGYRADGMMTNVTQAGYNCAFNYQDNGL